MKHKLLSGHKNQTSRARKTPNYWVMIRAKPIKQLPGTTIRKCETWKHERLTQLEGTPKPEKPIFKRKRARWRREPKKRRLIQVYDRTSNMKSSRDSPLIYTYSPPAFRVVGTWFCFCWQYIRRYCYSIKNFGVHEFPQISCAKLVRLSRVENNKPPLLFA